MSHSRAESWEHSHEHRRRSHGSELPSRGWDICIWNGRTEATNTFGGDLIVREGKYEYIDMIDWTWFFVGLLDCRENGGEGI
jgi:hypothetical protein